MLLFLMAQDIHSITFGSIDETIIKDIQTVQTPPERYLKCLAEWLDHTSVRLKNVDGIVAVLGPGSFTSCRMSLMIANTIAFTQQISIIPLENPKRLVAEELLHSCAWQTIVSQPFVWPVYDRAAHIGV